MTPTISVIMPMRNAERFVLSAARSVLRQTLKEFELIVVDDASEDTSASKIASLSDPRVRVLRNSQQEGVAISLNRALAEVRSPFIARMDADDVCHPERLRRQLAFLEENPEIGVVSTSCCEMDEHGSQTGLMERPSEHYLLAWELYFGCVIIHPSVMIRTDVILDAGGYATNFPHAEDYDLWLRLVSRTGFANLSEPLLSYRRHSQQVGQQYRPVQRQSISRIRGAAVSALLGKDIPELTGSWWGSAAWGERLESEQAVQTIGNLLTEAAETFIAKQHLRRHEANIIRTRAISRLQGIAALHLNRMPMAALGLLAHVLHLQPEDR